MRLHHLKSVGNWLRNNSIVVLSTVFYLLYAVILSLPAHYSWFQLHRDLMALGQVLVGFVEFPLRFCSLFTFGAPSQFMGIFTFLYFLLAGYTVGKVVQILWRKGGAGRVAILVGFLANSAMGLFMLAWSDILVTAEPAQTCEEFVSPQNGIRIVEFDEVGILPGVHFFYLFTGDGGDTWQQLMTTRFDDPINPDCSTIGSLEDNFIWIWSSYGVRTTQDNGKTWTKWDWECCMYGAVEQVSFQDNINGIMRVYPWQSEISELITTDGGKTWEPR